MLKLSFVAKDDTKREAKRIASQDHSVVIDMRIVGTVITAIFILFLIVSYMSLDNEYQMATKANKATIFGLEQNNSEKQNQIDSLQREVDRLKAEKAKAADDSVILENGILDASVYGYALEDISFMRFSKQVSQLDYTEDRKDVYHDIVLVSSENASADFEYSEKAEKLDGCYLLVELEDEWGYIPLDLGVTYTVKYRDFESWKNAYIVFKDAPTYASISIGWDNQSFGVNNLKVIDNGAYAQVDLSDGIESSRVGSEICLWELET